MAQEIDKLAVGRCFTDSQDCHWMITGDWVVAESFIGKTCTAMNLKDGQPLTANFTTAKILKYLKSAETER